MGMVDLIRLGLISNRGLVLVAAGLGGLADAGQSESSSLVSFMGHFFETLDTGDLGLFGMLLGGVYRALRLGMPVRSSR